MVTASAAAGSSGTAASASRTGPDDLAAESNTHETELNPQRQVRRLARLPGAASLSVGMPGAADWTLCAVHAAGPSRRPWPAWPWGLQATKVPLTRSRLGIAW